MKQMNREDHLRSLRSSLASLTEGLKDLERRGGVPIIQFYSTEDPRWGRCVEITKTILSLVETGEEWRSVMKICVITSETEDQIGALNAQFKIFT